MTPSHWCKLIFLTGHRTHTVSNCPLMGGALLQISLQAERFWLKKKTKKWLQTIYFSLRRTGSSVQAAVLLWALGSCRDSELHYTAQHCWGIRSIAHPQGRMLRGQLWSSKGNVSISVVSTVSESHDTQTMKHRKSHPLEIKQWEHNQCNSFIVQIVLRNGSSKWRIWGLEKLRQLPNKNQNLIGFWYIFTMRESTEVETR